MNSGLYVVELFNYSLLFGDIQNNIHFCEILTLPT